MTHTSIEALESRIAPAILLPGGKIVTFTDTDGDSVTVKFSKPILTDANVGTLLTFDSAFGSTGPQHLITIDLNSLPASANGVNITVKASPGASGGNGEVDIASINASNVTLDTSLGTGIDLGKVRVDGSLNFIDAGDTDLTTPALKSLTVTRLGAEVAGVESSIHGSVGAIDILDTMQGKIRLAGNAASDRAQLSIGSVHIGGSLLGGSAAKSGSIEAQDIDSLIIEGNFIGGSGPDSGRVIAGNIAKVIVRGSIIGGPGDNSAVLNASNIDSAVIGGSMIGSVGFASGRFVTAQINSLKIGGDVIGGDGDFSGQIRPNFLGTVRIGGDVIGGNGLSSAGVGANDVNSIVIGGSVFGGKGQGSGSLSANTIGVVRIGGDLVGGAGDFSGRIFGGGKLRSIGGSILGRLPDSGDATAVAGIYASIFDIEKITIGGDVIAANIAVGVSAGTDQQFGTGDDSQIGVDPTHIGSLRIGGHVAGPVTNISFGIEANAIDRVRIGGVSFADGVGGVDFSTGLLVDPQGTVKLRTV